MSNYYQGTFKKKFSLSDRLKESNRVVERYPERIPIIVEHSHKSKKDFPKLDKQKYLVPKDLTLGQFSYVIRKRIKLESHKAMFIMFDNGSLAPTNESMGKIYYKHKDDDNFLYVIISGENTFG